MGTIKGRKGKDLKKAEDIKKSSKHRKANYTENILKPR